MVASPGVSIARRGEASRWLKARESGTSTANRRRAMYFDFRDKPERLCVKEMVHGYNISCCLFVAVELELADLLAEGPLSLVDLARRSGTDPDALKRILRLLMSAGIFSVDEQDKYTLTPRAEFLR